MIGLNVDVFFLLYLGAGFSLIFSLWFYYEMRDGRIHENRRSKVIFHCIKCGQIYTGPAPSEERDCPACHFTNGRLRF